MRATTPWAFSGSPCDPDTVWLDEEFAAQRFGISRRTILRLRKRGLVRSRHVEYTFTYSGRKMSVQGFLTQVAENDLMAYLDQHIVRPGRYKDHA